MFFFIEPRKPVGANLDIVFLVDSSSNVTRGDFANEKQFVSSLGRYLNISGGKSRGAMITYGQTASIIFGLDSTSSFREFSNLVSSTPYIGGPGRLDQALGKSTDVFQDSHRKSVPRIAVLITPLSHFSGASSKLIEGLAKQIRNSGIKIHVISIGRDHEQILAKIVSRQQDVIPVNSFSRLKLLIPSIGREIAKGAGIVRRCVQETYKGLETCNGEQSFRIFKIICIYSLTNVAFSVWFSSLGMPRKRLLTFDIGP